jgi:hypothetical protein
MKNISVEMWIAISQIAACISSVIFTTLHKVPPHIIDYGQNFLPLIPSECAHITCAAMVFAAAWWGKDQYFYFQNVYAPAMFIKATLLPLTILPDSNPECANWHPLKCLTRNDMLPSGHMLAASAASLCFDSPLALAGAGVCGIMLVSSKMHFSVDVILSAWLIRLLYVNSLPLKM